MSRAAVVVDRLTKIYRIHDSPWDRFVDVLSGGRRHREFRALGEVSFEVPQGGRFAVIGDNGAGKSTLLRILAGITTPTSGEARVEGRVSSILELGSGFHPEFSGRQNLVLNAAMLGLSAAQVRQKTRAIIDFSELGDFIDQPVKTYSTGMVMRLGFAIATQTEPEVLIIDEALSVGDATFQKKCVDQLTAYCRSGGTLVFCTHAMYYAATLCNRAVWLRSGRVEACGPVLEVVQAYENHLAARRATSGSDPDRAGEADGQPARLTRVVIRQAGSRLAAFRHGDPWSLEIGWEAQDTDSAFHVGVGIDRVDGLQICSFGTLQDGCAAFTGRRRHAIALELPELPIVRGEFSVYVFLLDENGLHAYDKRVLERAFRVEDESYEVGLLRAEHRWREVRE